jgi:hypothetical protein
MVDVTYLFDPAHLLLAVIGLGMLILKVWALVDCIRRPAPMFEAHSKQTKTLWLVILVAAVLLFPTTVLSIFGLVGTVAAVVYLVDVRPAVSGTSNPWG